MFRRVVAPSAVLLALVLSGCSGSDSSSSSSAKSGPGAAVEAFLMAGNAGDYAKAESYVASGSLASVKSMGTKAMLDMMTRDGTLKSVEIVSETESGPGVAVYARLLFQDGGMTDGTYSMIQEGGSWKLAL